MPASIQHESGNLFRIHISGLLRQAELQQVQAVAAQEIARLGRITLLFVLEGFEGWERGADWGDLAFYEAHDKDIDKIAIVVVLLSVLPIVWTVYKERRAGGSEASA